MRFSTICFIAVLVSLFSGQALCQQLVINNQNDFLAAIDNPIPWGEREVDPVPDYVINTPVPNNPYIVPVGSDWRLDDGISIEIGADVQINISGVMRTTPGQDGNPAPHIAQINNLGNPGDYWRSLTIVGNNIPNDNVGEIHLLGIDLEGGGAGVDPPNNGLIVLTGNWPELTIGDPILNSPSALQNSLSNGIVSITSQDDWNGRISLFDVQMDEEESIARVGVKMGDEQNQNLIGDREFPDLDEVLRIEGCWIQNCGSHGVAVYFFEDGDYTIRNSKVNLNGQDNNLGFGMGAYFGMAQHFYAQMAEILIEESSLKSNTGDGIRLWQISCLVDIHDSEMRFNGQCGFFDNMEGPCLPIFIDNNLIAENGTDGLHTYRMGVWEDGAILVRGNHFEDNTNANIRLRGTVSSVMFQGNRLPAEIANNTLIGANYGIVLANAQAEGIFSAPIQVLIHNNIQYNATVQGLRIEDIGGDVAIPDNPLQIFNNVFYGNGVGDPSVDPEVREAGIWIGLLVPAVANGNWIQNNILSDNSDFGIFNRTLNQWNFPNNGFDDNGILDCQGCVSNPGVFADPLFDNEAVGLEDFHLFWNSPMINRGNLNAIFDDADYPNIEAQPRDGSPNDMGAYGGPGAADYDFDPFCVIPSGAHVCNDNLPVGGVGGRDFLEWDYYRVFGSIYTSTGETIDIGDDALEAGAAYFEFTGNYRWFVQGTIRANGDPDNGEPRNIFFRPLEGVARWMRLEINIPDDDCNLHGCDMAGGGYEVYAYGGVELNVPDLFIRNCRLADSEYQNVLVSGDIPVHFTNCDFTGAQWDGLTIAYNENRSTVQTSNFLGNGSADTYYAGLRLSSSFPLTIVSNTIGLNPNRGVYFFSSGPNIGGQGIGPNVVYNNGPDQGQAGSTGAELYLTSTSDPTIAWTNVWDADGAGNRRGVFAYKSSGVAPATNMCYWGGDDIWDGEIAVFDGLDEQVKATFFNNVPVPNPAATTDDFIQGGAPVPPDIDSEEEFFTGLDLMEAGEYSRAILYFRSHLADHSGIYDFNSLQRLLICVRRSGGDLRELRSYYLEYAANERMEPLFAFEARRLAGMALLYGGNPEQAIEALNDLCGDAPTPADSIAALMDIAWAELVRRGGDGIDALFNYDARINDLNRLYEETVEQPSGNTALLPTQISLEPAWPNPFNSSTRLSFNLPVASKATLQVIDLQGRVVETLLNRNLTTDIHSVVWNAEGVAAGLYFCKLTANDQSVTIKLILTK